MEILHGHQNLNSKETMASQHRKKRKTEEPMIENVVTLNGAQLEIGDSLFEAEVLDFYWEISTAHFI